MKRIVNVHSRLIAAPAATVAALLDTLGGPDDRVWPAEAAAGRSVRERQHDVAAAAVPATIAGLAVLHAAWALGWRWPGGDDEAFAERVIGYGAGVPPAPATWTVAVLLGGAAGVVRAAGRPGAPPKLRAAAAAVGALFLLRGAVSIPIDVARGFDQIYERLDVTVYSPLCLAIGAGTAAALRPAEAPRAAIAGAA